MPKEMIAIINPKRRRRTSSGHKRRKARKNPDLMTIGGLVNPHRRGKGYRRSSKKWTYRKRRAHRNPFLGGGGGGLQIGMESIGFTVLGAVGSKIIPGYIPWVKERNKGLVGYAAQAATGGLLYVLLAMLFKQKKAAQYVLLGTAVSLATTALDDFWFKKQAATVKGLGFYPDQQLTNYNLNEIDDDYEVVDGLGQEDDESYLIGQYEDTPLDQQMLGLGAPTIRKTAMPGYRSTGATGRPVVRNALACGRMQGRW